MNTQKFLRYGLVGGFIAGLMVLEGVAMAALLWGQGPVQGIGFALGHGLASIGAAALWHVLPARYRRRARERRGHGRPLASGQLDVDRRQRWSGYALIVLIVFSLPVFGLFGLLAAILPALYAPVKRRARDWRRIDIPPLPLSPVFLESGRSPVADAHSLVAILQDQQSSVDDRMSAVIALRHVHARAGVPILRLALRDPVDDIRLLAYAMLYRRDTALQSRIHYYERALAKDDPKDTDKVALHYALAQLHWELSYCSLAVGAVEGRVLISAETNARAALDRVESGHEGDGITLATLFLLARILLRKGQYDEAEEMFTRAHKRGFPPASIEPFLAEIAFCRRDFAGVRAHLGTLTRADTRRPGVVEGICRFWLGEKD
ncbi:MAG: tetratricopeptide repeat protein [Proteobacteria bacterium]|nr:tetratricopeptide repeat protein [Pseudomonadota bacterium]